MPSMSKGENELEILRLPSSPKGEVVGIMILVWLYDTYVVLDGNPLISCREKFISCREKFISCRDHALSCREKFIEKSLFHVEKKFTHFHVGELTFSPW